MFNQKTLTNADLKSLKEKYQNNYLEYVEKVNNGYPVQYLIGEVPFFNTSILVNENVLIPRFETEFLVEKILNKLKKYENDNLSIIDIGTGSGCIAITLSKNTNYNYTGIDISKEALKIAKENNKRNGTKVKFIKKDILKEELEEFDIYISNPPYIGFNEPVDNTINYEPKIALYANNNGLEFYQVILEKIKNIPKLIAFEIGGTQSEPIKNLALKKFPNAIITIEKDLCGKNRYLFIEF